jgi:hypothetical protein
MPINYEEKLNQGRAISEMVKTEGWDLFSKKIKEEIKIEHDQIRSFDLEGKGLQDIAAEYIRHRESVNAYESVLSIVDDFLAKKVEAENYFRK